MKNKGLLITAIVLLSILILGLIGLMIFLLCGNGVTFSGVPIRSDTVILEQDYHDVTAVEVDSACGDISFVENTEDAVHIKVYGEERSDVTVAAENGKLSIRYPQKATGWIKTKIMKNDIIISLPATFTGSLSVRSDYGNITACDLPGAAVDVNAAYGAITLGRISTAKLRADYGNVDVGSAVVLDAELDLGNITVGSITQRCLIQNDCGDINVAALSVTENSRVEDNLGNIRIDTAKGVSVKADTDLGKCEVYDNDPSSGVILTVENDCGDIRVGKK